MKPKYFLIAVGVLLCMSVAAGATEMGETTAPAVVEAEGLVEELAVLAGTSSGCNKPVAAVPGRFEAPIVNMALTNMCGQCSNNPCKGRSRGSWCAPGKWCIPTLTNLCPGTLDWDCQCASYYY